MRRTLVLLFLLAPQAAGAQAWRVQASGGFATCLALRPAAQIRIGPSSSTHVTSGFNMGHMPQEPARFGAWGLAVMRRSGVLELGLQAEAMQVRRQQSGSYAIYDANGRTTSGSYKITGYVGRPVVPVTAVCNYYAGPKRGSGFVGLHAGLAYAAGGRQAEFGDLALASRMSIYYNSAWGFAAGVQAGYRKELGPFDLGFQLQAKFLQFNLQHGNSPERYLTRTIVLPVQLYAGFRFGPRGSKTIQS